jgi:HK97 family phage prohead protease
LLWSHDSRAPIGVWRNLQEDEKGLFCQGTIHPKAMPDGIPVLDIMRMGGIRGLSIGYRAVTADTDEKKKIRTLKEVDLWEISPVTFPMNARASITSVKGILEAKTPRELEDALREADMPREAAKYLVRLCKAGLREAGSQVRGDGREWNALADELKKINEQLGADLTAATIRDAAVVNF